MAGPRCHAASCNRPVAPDRLMCRPHWFMVPRELRDRIWATYRAGQNALTASPEYLEAVHAAMEAVAEKESGRA